MFAKLLSRSKPIFTRSVFKHLIRVHGTKPPPDGKVVKAGDTCYIPVPCPSDGKQPSGGGEIEQIFKRLVRGEPGKVRLGFIPEEWFEFFYKKTGVTGPYVFCVTFSSYLLSKEIYVLEHEYYAMLSHIMLWYVVLTQGGPSIGKALDKAIDEIEHAWNENRVQQKKVLEESIEDETKLQLSADGQIMLQNAKRENIGLQLEAEYRKRMNVAYVEVKKRLDYHLSKHLIERRFLHKNLNQWVVQEVLKSYTDEKAKETIDACLAHLGALASKQPAT